MKAASPTGAIAITIGLVLRMQGMSHWIMWEVAALFENIGIVQDGIETIARERSVVDRPGAPELRGPRGEIRYDHIRFNYGKDADGRAIIDDLSLDHQARRKGRPRRSLGRRQVDAGEPASALLRSRERPHPHRRPGHRQGHPGSLREQIGMVTQDTSLLHRSVCDNIRYGRPDATRAR